MLALVQFFERVFRESMRYENLPANPQEAFYDQVAFERFVSQIHHLFKSIIYSNKRL